MTRVDLGWAKPFDWRVAALCFPAMPALLLAGITAGDIGRGAVAAGAALFVGLGLSRPVRGHPWTAMLANALAITAAAFVGTLTGRQTWLFVACAGAAAAACAMLSLVDEGWWWVTLQTLTTLLAGGFYSGDLALALQRATDILTGGLTQALCVIVLARLLPGLTLPSPPQASAASYPEGTMASFSIQAVACVTVSLMIARLLGLSHGYWAPMTAMLVIKPSLEATWTRGLARFVGTVAGCAAATAYALAVDSRPGWLVFALALTAGLSFAVLRANYATWTAAMTATMVLLISLSSGTAEVNAEHRLLATLIGGTSALFIALLPSARIWKRFGTGRSTIDRMGRA